MDRTNRLLPVLLLSALLPLGGCIPGEYAIGYTTYANAAPPVPYDEFVGTAPGPGFVWVNGYWWWDGGDYVWIRGRWAQPPDPGFVWVRSGWVHEGNRYVYVHGRWARPARATRYRYVHPAPRVRVSPGVRYRTAPRRSGGRGTVRVN